MIVSDLFMMVMMVRQKIGVMKLRESIEVLNVKK